MKLRHFSSHFLAQISFYVVGGVIGCSILYEPLLPYATLIAVFFLLMRWVTDGRSLVRVPTNLPVLVLLLMVMVSWGITPVPKVTILQTNRLLNGILFFLCCFKEVHSRQRVNLVLAGLGGSGLLLAVGSLFFVDWPRKFMLIPKALSVLTSEISLKDINPNVSAGILAVLLAGICTILSFYWKTLNRVQKVGATLIVAAMFAIFFLLQSRGSMIALACALVVLVLLRFRYGWVVMIFGGIIVGLILFQTNTWQILNFLGDETGGGIATLSRRENIWLRASLMISDFPFTGIGLGTFNPVMDALYPLIPQSMPIPHAHNLFLQIALDLGIPGLIAWLACWYNILWMAWRLYRKGDTAFRALGAAVLCSQVAMGIHGLTDCVTWDARPAIFVWLIWGLTVAAWLQMSHHAPVSSE